MTAEIKKPSLCDMYHRVAQAALDELDNFNTTNYINIGHIERLFEYMRHKVWERYVPERNYYGHHKVVLSFELSVPVEFDSDLFIDYFKEILQDIQNEIPITSTDEMILREFLLSFSTCLVDDIQ